MAVRTRSLGLVQNPPSATWYALVTVPAGRTAICRHLSVVNASGADAAIAARIRRGAALSTVWNVPVAAAGATLVFPSAELALNPGDVLEVRATGAGTTSVSWAASGPLLEGAPA